MTVEKTNTPDLNHSSALVLHPQVTVKRDKLLWLEHWAHGTNIYREASRKERYDTGCTYFVFANREDPHYGWWIPSNIRNEVIDKLPCVSVKRLIEVIRHLSNKNLG